MKRALTMAAAAAATALTVAACGSEGGGMAGMDMSSSSTSSSTSTAAAGGPAEGENDEADVAFAQMMIPHHSQAIEMSEVLLAKDGVDERVTELAQRIKDAQQPEIDQMTGWLQGWGAEVPDGSMGSMEGMDHGGMGGMMSAEDMQALEDADADTASRLFLEQMIEHHTGAIEMAETQIEDGVNPEAVELARRIVADQGAEVTEMRELLASL